jgi:hypothetical protein
MHNICTVFTLTGNLPPTPRTFSALLFSDL